MTGIRISGKDLDELVVGLKSGNGVIACIIDITFRKNAEPQVKLNVTGVDSEAGERIAWIKDANLTIGDNCSFDIVTIGDISHMKNWKKYQKMKCQKRNSMPILNLRMS